MTKGLLGAGLKDLMQKKPFEKITIKMITDAAGVIRPTFYNHFKDKYELLEYIFQEEIGNRIREMLMDGMEKEGIKLLFLLLERDREFYKKAFLVEGQNGFEEIVSRCFYHIFEEYLQGHSLIEEDGLSFLPKNMIALYYAVSLANMLKLWLLRPEPISAQQMAKACYYLMTHSIAELIQMKE